MPGSCTSMPKIGLPVTLSLVSRRGAERPRRFQSLGSLSFTSAGGSSLEAACATWPKRTLRFEGRWMIVLFSASQSAASTFQRCAAAISISRALAPALRRYSCEARIDWLPPVAIEPHTRLRLRFSALDTNSNLTLRQSHSSSSATSMGSPVELPCPISERATRISTESSGRMTIQAVSSGSFVAASAEGILSSSAKPAPSAEETFRKSRREGQCEGGMDDRRALRRAIHSARTAAPSQGPRLSSVPGFTPWLLEEGAEQALLAELPAQDRKHVENEQSASDDDRVRPHVRHIPVLEHME